MELKELVPPPEVCAKIPIGEFKDSFAVYLVTAVNMDKPLDISKQSFELMPRGTAERLLNSGCEAQVLRAICPAPTLQDIMAELPALSEVFWSDFNDGSKLWMVANSNYESNPNTAALEQWLFEKGYNKL